MPAHHVARTLGDVATEGGAGSEATAASRPPRTSGAGWRHAAAFVLVVGVLLIVALTDWLSVSESHFVGGKVVYMDRPLAVGDLTTILVLILVLFLLLPDLSEVAIPGFISLKRRVDDAEKRVDQVSQQLISQQTRLDTIALAHATASVGDINFTVGTTPPTNLDGLVRGLPEKAQNVLSGNAGPTEPFGPVTGTQAQLIQQLIAGWEDLDNDVLITESRATFNLREMPIGLAEKRQRFTQLFDDEIRAARQARNAVAHARPMSEEQLREAVEIVTQLRRIWDEFPGKLG